MNNVIATVKNVVNRAALDLRVTWEIAKEIDEVARPYGKEAWKVVKSPEAIEVYKETARKTWEVIKWSGRTAYYAGWVAREICRDLQVIELSPKGNVVDHLVQIAETVKGAKVDPSIAVDTAFDAEVDDVEVVENAGTIDIRGVEPVFGPELPKNVSKLRSILSRVAEIDYKSTGGRSRSELKEAIESYTVRAA